MSNVQHHAVRHLTATDRATIRRPCADDGAAVHDLIARCPPLDRNSLYCNLLQCSHFADTAALAETGGRLLGFVSGHRLPDTPRTLFVWQVAVAPEARGQRLARRLVEAILARPANRDIDALAATVTADNVASFALFAALARRFDAPLARGPGFDGERHLAGRHASELRLDIGPFGNRAAAVRAERRGARR